MLYSVYDIFVRSDRLSGDRPTRPEEGTIGRLAAAPFPLVHLPNDVQRGFKPPTVAFNFAWRSEMTLAFDAAYDRGGLPLSVALHYWSNLLLATSRWWFYGGNR